MSNADAGVFAGALGQSDARASRRLRVGGLMTAVGSLQTLLVVQLSLGAALRPAATDAPEAVARLVFAPAPAAALPPPQGSPRGARADPSRNVTLREQPQVDLPAAVPLVPVAEPKPLEREPQPRPDEAFGSVTGSASGVVTGMEGGIPEGEIDGTREGMPGGVPNGAGLDVVSDYDAPPRMVRQMKPRYPPLAFLQKVQGTVLLEIVIDPSGHVSRTRVVQSIPLLDAAAREAANQWLFKPALKNGRPVASVALAPVRFGLY